MYSSLYLSVCGNWFTYSDATLLLLTLLQMIGYYCTSQSPVWNPSTFDYPKYK